MVAPLKDSLSHIANLQDYIFFEMNPKEYIENGYTILQSHLSQKTFDVLREHESLIFEDFIKNSNIEIDIDVDINKSSHVSWNNCFCRSITKPVRLKHFKCKSISNHQKSCANKEGNI